MAVKLRLKRMGSKQKPFYRIVAADSRSPRDGRFIETIGTYNPIKGIEDLNIDEEKALKWLNNGAIPTDTVKNLFTKKGINAKYSESKANKAAKPAKATKTTTATKTAKTTTKTTKTATKKTTKAGK